MAGALYSTVMDDAQPVSYRPLELLLRLSTRWPVIRSRLGQERYAYVLGPRANAYVFAHDELFSAYEAMKALIPVDGPTSVVVSDGEDHTRRRGAIRPALAPRSVAGYVAAMDAAARDSAQSLGPGVRIDAYPLFRSAIRRSTLRALFGSDMAQDADALGEHLQPLLDLVDRLPQSIAVHERLRTPMWRRAMTSRRWVDDYISSRVDAVEAAGPHDATDGILSLLVHGRDGLGSGLSRAEIRDQAVTLIAAGYETTSAAMGWAAFALATRPQWQTRAREEARRWLARGTDVGADVDADVDVASIAELKILPAIVTETLRLYPPATISARYVETTFSFEGHAIEQGTTLLFSPYVTQRDPRVFDRPAEFDPGRWLDTPRVAPEVFLPFGGGIHRCIGSHLAMTELTVMLAHLVAAGPFRFVGRRPRASTITALRPSHVTIEFAPA